METSESKNSILEKHSWLENPASKVIPVQLNDIMKEVIAPSGLSLTAAPQREQESAEYGACIFELDHKKVLFRVANTTPTKIGQFVTIWKRPLDGGEIEPIDTNDHIDYVFISVFDAVNRGIFIFNKKILAQKEIMSINGKGGKRAIRVYAPWTKPVVKQAIQTQKWQVQYFFPMNAAQGLNLALFQKILKQ